jgi:hypothetical protein
MLCNHDDGILTAGTDRFSASNTSLRHVMYLHNKHPLAAQQNHSSAGLQLQ